MLAAYLCWMLSATCFVHTHNYSWGKVTHSHPYSDSRHTHSQSACQLIGYLDWAVAEKAADTIAVAVDFVVLGKVDRPDIRVSMLRFAHVRFARLPFFRFHNIAPTGRKYRFGASVH